MGWVRKGYEEQIRVKMVLKEKVKSFTGEVGNKNWFWIWSKHTTSDPLACLVDSDIVLILNEYTTTIFMYYFLRWPLLRDHFTRGDVQ